MKQLFRFTARIACVVVMISLPVITGHAADKLSYSGKYSVERLKTTSGSETETALDVVQTEDNIEVTRVELGKRTTSWCPFNGSEGDYTSPGGVPGKCKAQLKTKYLILESVVVARPQPTAPSVHIQTRERWQLSADAKTLTLKTDVDFPDVPSGIEVAIAGGTLTRKYTRTENP